VYNYFLSYSD